MNKYISRLKSQYSLWFVFVGHKTLSVLCPIADSVLFITMLSEAALRDFQKIYKEEFGKEIPESEALEVGANLLTLFNHIYRPVKKGWFEENKNEERRRNIEN